MIAISRILRDAQYAYDLAPLLRDTASALSGTGLMNQWNSFDRYLSRWSGLEELFGGAGDDEIEGDSGVDIYRFGAGMGRDTVIETGRPMGNPFGDALIARSRRWRDGGMCLAQRFSATNDKQWRAAA